VADVEAVLFFRETNKVHAVNTNRLPLKTIGWAPLTSMFWFGKNSERKFDDYRPEVHDTDGLLVHMDNGEVFWQPLDNPAVMRHQVFSAPNIRGFGLLQRERSFTAYQDAFNLFQLEPGVWIEPHGSWGDGDLHLVELSAVWEGFDNIVAFWDPKEKPAPLQPCRFGYTLRWLGDTSKLSENRVMATRVGLDAVGSNKRQFVIDFDGPGLDVIPENDPPQAIANCSDNATLYFNQVLRNPFAGTWRVILKMEPRANCADPVNLRCTLQKGTNVLSETWTYQWSPP
jgi:glucans biosynthesis protein